MTDTIKTWQERLGLSSDTKLSDLEYSPELVMQAEIDELRAALAQPVAPHGGPPQMEMHKMVNFQCECGKVHGFPEAMIPSLPAREPISDEQIKLIYQIYGTGRLDGFTAAIRAIDRARHWGDK
jgi:hypothetical protein